MVDASAAAQVVDRCRLVSLLDLRILSIFCVGRPAVRPVSDAPTLANRLRFHHPSAYVLRMAAVRRRWAETADARHIYPGDRRKPGEQIVPLCNSTAATEAVVSVPRRQVPECAGCDVAWRCASTSNCATDGGTNGPIAKGVR